MRYHDVIAYCDDTAALVAEIAEKLPARLVRDEDGNARLLWDKTPTIRQGGESLALARLTDADLAELEAAGLDHLRLLGTFEEVFADPELSALYDRIYPQTVDEIGPEGETETVTLPRRFGAFA